MSLDLSWFSNPYKSLATHSRYRRGTETIHKTMLKPSSTMPMEHVRNGDSKKRAKPIKTPEHSLYLVQQLVRKMVRSGQPMRSAVYLVIEVLNRALYNGIIQSLRQWSLEFLRLDHTAPPLQSRHVATRSSAKSARFAPRRVPHGASRRGQRMMRHEPRGGGLPLGLSSGAAEHDDRAGATGLSML